MRLIKDIICKMHDTLAEAEWYANHAELIKEEHPNLAAIYIKIADAHIIDYNQLHVGVVSIINEYRKDKGDPPANMKAIWDYEHEALIEEMTALRKQIDRIR